MRWENEHERRPSRSDAHTPVAGPATKPADATATGPVRSTRGAWAAWIGCLLACMAVPSALSAPMWGNENLYLVEFIRSAQPSRMAGDWTLSRLTQDRPVFDLLFRPLAMIDSYTAVALTGRLLSWCAVAGAFVFLCRQLGVRRWWLVVGAFFAWLVPAPYSVAKEWVVGTFEAKPFAYALLFVALALVIRGRPEWAALAAGLCVSIHAVIGIWVFGMVLVALGVVGVRGRRWLRSAVLAALAAGPGIVSVLASAGGSDDADGAGDIRWYTRGVWAVHFDATQFPRARMAGLVLLVGASVVMTVVMVPAMRTGGPVRRAWKVLFTAEIIGMLAFLGGVALRALGADRLLMLMPYRVGPVLVVMGAMVRIAWLIEHRAGLGAVQGAARIAASRRIGGPWLAAAGAVLALTGLLGPVARGLPERVSLVTDGWSSRLSDPHLAYRWASSHLPATAVVATDPTDQPFAELDRPIVASYTVPPIGSLRPWRQRIIDLTGRDVVRPGLYDELRLLSQGFAARPEVEVLAWRARYGVTHLISSGRYPFRELHREGNVSVYELPAP